LNKIALRKKGNWSKQGDLSKSVLSKRGDSNKSVLSKRGDSNKSVLSKRGDSNKRNKRRSMFANHWQKHSEIIYHLNELRLDIYILR